MSKKEIDKIIKEFPDLDRRDLEKSVKKFGIDVVTKFINLVHTEGSGEVLPLFGSGDFYYYLGVYEKCQDIQAVIALVLGQNDPEVTTPEQRRLAEQVTGEVCGDDEEEEKEESESSNDSSDEDDSAGGATQLKRVDSVDSLCSIYSLLSSDNDNGDRLGVSLNLEYGGKFIPGNNIHEQLSRYQNEYREVFYRSDNGIARFGGNFQKIYEQNKTSIIKAQDKARKSPKLTESERVGQLYDCVGSRYVVTVKTELAQPNKVYPNFAVAKLSYVKNGKLYSKCISIPREHLDGHSEIQIFERARKIIKSWKDQKPDFVILDINSALSMCDDCYSAANDFISEMENKLNIKVRVSYNFGYSKGGTVVSRGNGETLFQWQVELPAKFEAKSKSFGINAVIPSSGYASSVKHKKSIKDTDFLLNKLVLEDFELDLPEGITIGDVLGDGNCFFHAVKRQFARIGVKMSAEMLRKWAVKYLQDHPEEFSDFVDGSSYEEYIDTISQNGAWADHQIIQALANELKIIIVIVNNNHIDHPTYINPQNVAEGTVVHTIYLGHIGELHYVSLDGTAETLSALDEQDIEDEQLPDVGGIDINAGDDGSSGDSQTSGDECSVAVFGEGLNGKEG